MPLRSVIIAFLVVWSVARSLLAQPAPNGPEQPVRVNVTMNPDGTRTTYEFDQTHHRATATTTTPEGKLTGTMKYAIDDAGRFSTGVSTGPDGKFRFKSVYKYTSEGRLDQETHLDRENSLVNKIVYSYDSNGRQTGYVVMDAAGNIIGRTTPTQTKPSPPPKQRKKK
jgi:hypothetical protein